MHNISLPVLKSETISALQIEPWVINVARISHKIKRNHCSVENSKFFDLVYEIHLWIKVQLTVEKPQVTYSILEHLDNHTKISVFIYASFWFCHLEKALFLKYAISSHFGDTP